MEISPPVAWRSEGALSELLSEAPAPTVVRELLAADKRLTTLALLIPLLGPWFIYRSESHSPSEKQNLSWISIGITALAVAVLLALLPTPSELNTRLEERIETEINVLGSFADQYRVERGAYPSPTTWRRFAERADPRFYDPWGRPYRYQETDHGITIRSFGRDGVEGGAGEDADVWAIFPVPNRLGLARSGS